MASAPPRWECAQGCPQPISQRRGAQGDPSGPQAHTHKETHVPPFWKGSLGDSKPSAVGADLVPYVCVIIP